MISGSEFTWRLITGCVPQGLIQGAILFNNNVERGVKFTGRKFVDDTNWRKKYV